MLGFIYLFISVVRILHPASSKCDHLKNISMNSWIFTNVMHFNPLLLLVLLDAFPQPVGVPSGCVLRSFALTLDSCLVFLGDEMFQRHFITHSPPDLGFLSVLFPALLYMPEQNLWCLVGAK